MIRLPFLLVPLAMIAAGAGCRTATPPPTLALAGTAWSLLHLEEAGVDHDPVPPDELVFRSDGRGVRLRTCNECAGLYGVARHTLEVTQLACTRRACPDGRLELDRYIAGRSRWLSTGDRLILDVDDRVNGTRATLTFRRIDAPVDSGD